MFFFEGGNEGYIYQNYEGKMIVIIQVVVFKTMRKQDKLDKLVQKLNSVNIKLCDFREK